MFQQMNRYFNMINKKKDKDFDQINENQFQTKLNLVDTN